MRLILDFGCGRTTNGRLQSSPPHSLRSRIREFDLAGGWHEQGAVSCAQWLSWRIGMGMGAAREKVRVAHRLAELPLIDAAFGAGELSYWKVRAMTRVATADNEELLLTMARQTTAAQLERTAPPGGAARRYATAARASGPLGQVGIDHGLAPVPTS